MMINKRLIGICEDSKKYIVFTVISSWISIVCNILIILLIGSFINKIYLGSRLALGNGESVYSFMNNFMISSNISLLRANILIAFLLGIRYLSNICYGKFSYLASANARVTLRELIYKKSLKLEPTYSSEEAIWESIYELAKRKTVLVISHRLANVKNADNIYVMKNGTIIKSGNHESLCVKQGEYSNMINKQIELENIRVVC